jgi:hypothetical protein
MPPCKRPTGCSAGRTVTMPTASSRRGQGGATLIALLSFIFVLSQTAALMHEMEHVVYQHDAQCALHLAADHLLLMPPPDPDPLVAPGPVLHSTVHLQLAPPARPPRLTGARAPPLLP